MTKKYGAETYGRAGALPGATRPRSRVGLLGLGAMGRALKAALVRAGYRTTVWNLTPAKAGALGFARGFEGLRGRS